VDTSFVHPAGHVTAPDQESPDAPLVGTSNPLMGLGDPSLRTCALPFSVLKGL